MELYFPNFEVKFPCFSLPFTCNKTNCCYWEKTIPEYGNCTIRIANKGEHKLERLSEILGITRERVRQIEASALRHLAWTATKRGLSGKIRNIVVSTFGDVCFWPLRPFDVTKYRQQRKPSELELIDKAFYLGVFSFFLKKEVTLPVAECWVLDKVVSGFVCLLCSERDSCPSTPLGQCSPEDYLTVSSFSEMMIEVKKHLGLISSQGGTNV